MHMLGSLTDEYAELLTRLAVKQEPLEMGQELHVGQPRPPPPYFASWDIHQRAVC